jgi:hypothetical protein
MLPLVGRPGVSNHASCLSVEEDMFERIASYTLFLPDTLLTKRHLILRPTSCRSLFLSSRLRKLGYQYRVSARLDFPCLMFNLRDGEGRFDARQGLYAYSFHLGGVTLLQPNFISTSKIPL